VEETAPRKGYWGELWALARKIQEEFKGTRFPTRADRETAWNKFNELRDLARKRSESNRIRMEESQRQWERKTQESTRARSAVEAKASQTAPLPDIIQAIASPILIPIQLAEALLRGILGLEQLDHAKEELLSCNDRMQEAWALFEQSKNELLPGDKAQTYQCLSDAKTRLEAAWARWKEESNRLWQSKQQERVTGNIHKLEGELESATSALERQEARLEKLRSDLANAWNEGFKERCSEWIEECEQRITDIQERISRLKSWIAEEKAKLR
jgi:predicted  nucleic acid-binding Zn-ribbon protein